MGCLLVIGVTLGPGAAANGPRDTTPSAGKIAHRARVRNGFLRPGAQSVQHFGVQFPRGGLDKAMSGVYRPPRAGFRPQGRGGSGPAHTQASGPFTALERWSSRSQARSPFETVAVGHPASCACSCSGRAPQNAGRAFRIATRARPPRHRSPPRHVPPRHASQSRSGAARAGD